MEEHSIVEGKVCIVKFHENRDRDNRNGLITRSLGKFGVIHTAWYEDKRPDQCPQKSEFWKVRVVKEIGVGHREGCFVLHPLERVHVVDVKKLIPGMYTQEFRNQVLIVLPNKVLGKDNFILPLAIRKDIKGVYAIIVDLVNN